MDEHTVSAERSQEEIAWDEEFNEKSEGGLAGTIADVAKLAVQVPVAVMQMPMNLLPPETRRHGRAALREGFLALRTFMGAIGDNVEKALAEPGGQPAAVTGATDGTWGSGPARPVAPATSSTPTSKVKHIELGDEVPVADAGSSAIDELKPAENRGLRADIEY